MDTPSSHPPRRWVVKTLFLVLSLFLALLWGWIDYRTESEVVLSVFYLVPIVISAWYVHGGAGIFLALLCAMFAAYDSEIQMGVYARNQWIGVWASASRLIFFFLTASLIGRLRRTMDSIRQMAMTDSLTGVYNARSFLDFLKREIERGRRSRHPLSLLYIDLDDFKKANDSLGHQAGNAILEAVAGVLTRSVRRMDIAARLGGDEFAVLLPETGKEAVRKTVERIRENLSAETGRKGWPVTMSIGAVTYHSMDCTADDIIRKADDLMYRVKHAGKNDAYFDVIEA